mgnify:CR=1 FL=1
MRADGPSNTGNGNQATQWSETARLGVNASIGYFRRALRSEESMEYGTRQSLCELLDLMEEYVNQTWPSTAVTALLSKQADERVREGEK